MLCGVGWVWVGVCVGEGVGVDIGGWVFHQFQTVVINMSRNNFYINLADKASAKKGEFMLLTFF